MCKISKKNIFASLLAVSMIFTMMSTTVVHAQSVKDGSNEVTVTPNVGVSYVSPEETIETRGTSRPSKVWNIKSKRYACSLFILESSSCYPYVEQAHTAIPESPLSDY